MLVPIGKSIELDVDVTRFNGEVHDHILRTGLRNLLMDAHASATAKADPEGYVKKSRELAEKKLASLYAGVVRAQSFGGPKAPTDPVAMVILRLARKAVISRPEVTAASKADRLATINRLAGEYAKEHDAQLRPRAQKIVALENDEAEPAPVKKHEPMPTKKEEGGLNVPDLRDGVSRLRPHFYLAVARATNARIARPGVVVPDIITDARAAISRAMAGGSDGPTFGRTHRRCALVKTYAHYR